jgi:hypothetical protein
MRSREEEGRSWKLSKVRNGQEVGFRISGLKRVLFLRKQMWVKGGPKVEERWMRGG